MHDSRVSFYHLMKSNASSDVDTKRKRHHVQMCFALPTTCPAARRNERGRAGCERHPHVSTIHANRRLGSNGCLQPPPILKIERGAEGPHTRRYPVDDTVASDQAG